jgi:hypothetical protein
MSFLQEQFAKEKAAAKRVWSGYLIVLIVFWTFIGFALLFSPGWPIGLFLLAAAGYILYRRKSKSTRA